MTPQIRSFGNPDEDCLTQLEDCVKAEAGAVGVLCADHHKGYSMPIGGVVAYRDHVSPSAVGFDIGCGNLAVKLDVGASSLPINVIMHDITQAISFGVGRTNAVTVEHPVLQEITKSPLPFQRGLATLAADQLGTVGGGNHFVDLFEATDDKRLWVGVHFGSRGFGWKTAEWAIQEAGRTTTEGMDAPPILIPRFSPLGQDYLAAMEIAGRYAMAGREWVIERVRAIIGATIVETVHNHHNFAWLETHGAERWIVHRKGATPAWPGQKGFIGGTMGGFSCILEGLDGWAAERGLRSTVHGAGRKLSRSAAKGKWKDGVQIKPGVVDWPVAQRQVKQTGVVLVGGNADEAPECYKWLPDVIKHHQGTVKVLHWLRPIGVAMAPSVLVDPYKD